MSDDLFQHGGDFEAGEVSGNVRLGKLEMHYEELFSEALEDGVITGEERARLDKAASSMGLDPARVNQLEAALQAAYEARHRVRVRTEPAEDAAPVQSLRPLEQAGTDREKALLRRIATLEARVAELEKDLEEAQTHLAVEVDFSDFGDVQAEGTEDPERLYRRLRHDARDVPTLLALMKAVREEDPDRALRVAKVLGFLGAADDDAKALIAAHPSEGLIRPSASITPDAWRRQLFHPDEEILTGQIFSVIVSAVLLGRIATLRHRGELPKLDPNQKQDPATSTLQAVRCFGWAASILGMRPPALHADPTFSGLAEMVPAMPPVSRLGKAALSGRSPRELAFVAGRHLAAYREDHFIRLLFPAIVDLEDIFLAALTIGQPGLPLAGDVKARVMPIANAIQPILEPPQVDRLRGHFLRFVEDGGRTNLQRWAEAADFTAARAGLLLADDIAAAKAMLAAEGASDIDAKMSDLIVFYTGERAGQLRRQIGVA